MTEAPSPDAGRRHGPVYASYVAAGGLVICFATILIQFLRWLFPTFVARGILFVCTLVVLEAFFSFWLIKRLPTAQRQIAYYRATELVVLLIALKLFAELRAGQAGLWKNILLWPVQFPFNILTGQYLLTVLAVLASWWSANLFASDLSLLGTEDAATLDDRFKATPLRDVILRRFLRLGIFVIILAGIPLQKIFQTSLPAVSNIVPVVITYFVLGIILLSLTRYITLETNWSQAKLHIPAQIPRRWFAYSAVILAILILLIGWLPTNLGMGLFSTLNAVLNIVYQFVLIIYGLVLLFISLIAKLVRTPANSQTPIPQITPPPEHLPTATASAFNWELLKSIFLWGGLIVLGIVALRQYIAFNQDLSKELRRFRPLHWIITAWDRFKASFRKANKSVGAFIRNSLQRFHSKAPESAGTGEWDFINPRRLSPRHRVIFYYLALVRRAREAGLPRQDGQTPYEYARSLTSTLKEEKDAVDALTESFIEARYSCHEIPAKAAHRAKSIWETIRQVLRNVRRSRLENNARDD
ncbi:MAG: DUF4129 domain-containing protein [Anaerolineales bacterium]|jgi:hypothetical protein